MCKTEQTFSEPIEHQEYWVADKKMTKEEFDKFFDGVNDDLRQDLVDMCTDFGRKLFEPER